MSSGSRHQSVEPDNYENSIKGQSVANYETNLEYKDLCNWQLPNINQKSMYKTKKLDFRIRLGQRTKEINIKFQNDTFSTNLLNKNTLKHYYKIR